MCLDGYWGTGFATCDAHVFEALDGKLTGSWEDYSCSVRRIPTPPVILNEEDLRVDLFDNASPGSSYRVVCRITHIPTGLVAESDELSNTLRAKQQAAERLIARISN